MENAMNDTNCSCEFRLVVDKSESYSSQSDVTWVNTVVAIPIYVSVTWDGNKSLSSLDIGVVLFRVRYIQELINPGTPMSLWPRSPHVQSLQSLILLIIQRKFLWFISHGVKYTYVINPNLKYRNVSAVLKKSKFNRCKPSL